MPYKTRQGRRLMLPRGVTNGRQHLVKLEGTVATFECTRGHHRMTHDFSKGPRPKRMSEQMLKKFAVYWGLGMPTTGARGHCNGWCQKCQNDIDGVIKK